MTPDTNVLLNLYRFQSEARDQLFGALEKLGDRLWIPYQVGLEFHRRRLDVMKDQEGYFTKTRDDVLNAIDALQGKVRGFGTRIGLGAEHIKKIDDGIVELNSLIADVVMKAEGLNEVRLGGHASDEVLARIDVLFENRVGGLMTAADLDDARKEALRRVKDQIPPGYKDKDKADPTGDYLLWRQLMTEAEKRKLPVMFITNDIKEGWVQREHGLTLGARYELRAEMMAEASVPFIIMTTGTFLHHAEKYLNAEVSDETIAQAKELPELFQVKAVRVRSFRPKDVDVILGLAGPTMDRSVIRELIMTNLAKRQPSEDVIQVWRAVFETAMQVNPITGEREEIDTAAGYITDFLGSGRATGDEIARAAAWVAVRDNESKKQESYDEPPADD